MEVWPMPSQTVAVRKPSALDAIRHLDYVILICEDMPKMRAFYAGTMGFRVHKDLWDGNWVELKVGSVLLVLRPRGLVQLKGRNHDGPARAGSAGLQLAFRVAPAEVEACHAALAAQGVPILDEPTDQPWAHRTLFFQDPEHNLLEVYADI
jgi:catechol 2,3-dioxygenase-like lactoylglutathione lyase family enzyme